jgi:hypothetical protein
MYMNSTTPFDDNARALITQTMSRLNGMITPLLPKMMTQKPMLLETEFAPGMQLFIGATSQLSLERPGNGGLRIWKYNSRDDAAAEVSLFPCIFPALLMPARAAHADTSN